MKKLILSIIFCLVSFYSFGYQIDENFTGQIIKKYKDGQVESIENFKNGKLNGEFKEFFEDGSLFQVGTFKNGEMKNIRVFYENGNLKFEQNLKDRKGRYKGYYPNGQLEEEGEVFQGEKIGVWRYYNEEGKLSSEVTY
jgi:antitoxin component YwqK of YwqJK toxin-antitoxin module